MDRGRWSLAMDGRASSGAGSAGRAVCRPTEAVVYASDPTCGAGVYPYAAAQRSDREALRRDEGSRSLKQAMDGLRPVLGAGTAERTGQGPGALIAAERRAGGG